MLTVIDQQMQCNPKQNPNNFLNHQVNSEMCKEMQRIYFAIEELMLLAVEIYCKAIVIQTV